MRLGFSGPTRGTPRRHPFLPPDTMRFTLLAGLLVALAPMVQATSPPPLMPYCTPADVEAKYDAAVLAQRTGDPRGLAIDQGKLAVAVADFASVMAPYVRERYGATAFGVAEPTLVAINVEGAYVELAKRRPTGLSDGDRADRLALIDQLKGIAAGRVALLLPPGSGEALPSIAVADSFRGNPREFGRRRWIPPIGGTATPLA